MDRELKYYLGSLYHTAEALPDDVNEVGLLAAKAYLDRHGIENQWILRDSRKFAIEILPTGNSLYNRHVKRLKEKLGVNQVVFDPPILTRRPDLTGIHEVRHAVTKRLKEVSPGNPWAPRVTSLDARIPPEHLTTYSAAQSFDEVLTQSKDLTALLRQFKREWRESRRHDFILQNTLSEAVGKAKLLHEVSERVISVSETLDPLLGEVESALRQGRPLNDLGFVRIGFPAHSQDYLAVSLKIEPEEVFKNGRIRPETWVFEIEKLRKEPDGSHHRTRLYKISIPRPLAAPAAAIDQVRAIRSSLAEARKRAGAQSDRANRVLSLLGFRLSEASASKIEEVLKTIEPLINASAVR